MRKIFTLFVAALCCAMMSPKASAIESYGTFWVDNIQYYFEVDNDDFHYVVLTAFRPEVTGHVFIPETIEYNVGGSSTWTVTSVADNTFGANCNVTSVDLPGTILSVTEKSFVNSKKLEYVIVRANVPPVVYDSNWQEASDTQLFNTMAKGVYVPNAVVQDYKNDSNWGKANIYPITEFQGIDEIVNRKSSSRKFIKDGQLLLELNGHTFNAQGAEVK